ncbi:MAG: hypothetical protein WC633_03280 [Desulfurivibrionaceae bacterium]|jgi:hypothetical protein
MKTMLTYFDRLLAAITFAEANEPEMAEEFLGGRKPVSARQKHAAKRSGCDALTTKVSH